jgi:hypothetical protein
MALGCEEHGTPSWQRATGSRGEMCSSLAAGGAEILPAQRGSYLSSLTGVL